MARREWHRCWPHGNNIARGGLEEVWTDLAGRREGWIDPARHGLVALERVTLDLGAAE